MLRDKHKLFPVCSLAAQGLCFVVDMFNVCFRGPSAQFILCGARSQAIKLIAPVVQAETIGTA